MVNVIVYKLPIQFSFSNKSPHFWIIAYFKDVYQSRGATGIFSGSNWTLPLGSPGSRLLIIISFMVCLFFDIHINQLMWLHIHALTPFGETYVDV